MKIKNRNGGRDLEFFNLRNAIEQIYQNVINLGSDSRELKERITLLEERCDRQDKWIKDLIKGHNDLVARQRQLAQATGVLKEKTTNESN
jgi:hypothetical protein